jgi:hypothetical protein
VTGTGSVRAPWPRTRLLPVTPLIVLAWLIYQPAEARPFDYVDFPENIVVLRGNDGFIAGFRALSEVYANHGRWSPVTMASLAGQWTVFDSWTPGWQLTRFLVMSVVTTLAYALYRRLGVHVAGAVAAASIMVVSPPAAVGWIRLSTAESLCLLFIALGCHTALSRPTRLTGVKLSLALFATMWTKEIVTAGFVLPVLLLICRRDDESLGMPVLNRQTLGIVGTLALTGLVGAAPILSTLVSAPSDSFAMRYASGGFSLSDVLGGSLAAWLPFFPVPERSPADIFAVAMAFVMLIVIGWREALRPSDTRRHWFAVLFIAVFIPLLGAIVYAPWPSYLLVYALSFALAGALLVGGAASGMKAAGGVARIVSGVFLVTVFSFAAAQAFNESARTRALHKAFAESVIRVAETPGIDSVAMEVHPSQFDPAGNFAPRFPSYAAMLGRQWPSVRDVPCGNYLRTAPGLMRIRFNVMCADPLNDAVVIHAKHLRFNWPSPIPRTDSVTVSFANGTTVNRRSGS